MKSNEADEILDQIQPRLIVSTYPVNINEAKLLHAAKEKSIPTLQHLLSWDNITCKGKFPVVADYFIVWGDIMKEELQEQYAISESKISICGVPHFDQHINERGGSSYRSVLENFGLDPTCPYLFFAMSSPRFAPREIDIVLWLANATENNKFGEKMQLVIRPHPQNVTSFMAKASWLDRLDKIKSKRVAIDYPKLSESKIRWSMKKEDMHSLSSLISACTVCFNSGSTVSIDALMHNKPVIITSFDGDAKLSYWNSARRLIDYAHLDKFIREGGATPVHSYEQLATEVLQLIANPEHNLPARRSALYRECFKDDGKATDRVIDAISTLMEDLK